MQKENLATGEGVDSRYDLAMGYNVELRRAGRAPLLFSEALLLLLLQVQAVVALHVRLDIEHAATALPLAFEHFHARVYVKVYLQRRRPLEHLVAHGTPVATRFRRRRVGVSTERRALAVRVLLVIVARQLLALVILRHVHFILNV